jgi:bleomycin hydrolase
MRVLPLLAALVTPALPAPLLAQTPTNAPRGPHYEVKYKDPVLEQLKKRDRERDKKLDKQTDKIRKDNRARHKRQRDQHKQFVVSLPPGQAPASPAVFEPIWHHKPVPQYLTGTCWSFAATSMLESEVFRQTGRKIKISEIYSVYHEYLDKAARFVRRRGDSRFSEGSETNAVIRVWRKYGAVPRAAYPGVVPRGGKHNHRQMFNEMWALLQHVQRQGLWDEKRVLAHLRVILDRYLGRPPKRFRHGGRTYTPKQFLRQVLRVDPRQYVDLMSTLRAPFYTRAEFEVPDNWWHDKGYHNVPLKAFYAALKGAIRKGYGLAVAIDVSEPGKDPRQDAMFVPAFDIPRDHIDQAAREYRLAHRVTTDDHGVHLVGFARHGGRDWFLVKDSGRSSRWGRHRGYYFVRGDYVRLKLLAFTVHRDAVKSLLNRFK